MPTTKTKNCKTGFACGSSCISKKKTCRKTAQSAEAKQKLDKVSKAASKVTKAASKTTQPAEAKQKLDKVSKATSKTGSAYDNKAELAAVQSMLKDLDISSFNPYNAVQSWEKVATAAGVDDLLPSGMDLNKITKVLQASSDINLGEAISMSTWVSNDFKSISYEALGKSTSTKKGKKLVADLDSVISKLAPATNDSIQESITKQIKKNNNDVKDIKRNADGSYSLTRVLNSMPVATTSADLLRGFKAFSFLNLAENPFYYGAGSDIVMQLNSKPGGSKGVLVDDFKNSLYEGEVLFGQNAKLSVRRVMYNDEEYPDVSDALKAKKADKNLNLPIQPVKVFLYED